MKRKFAILNFILFATSWTISAQETDTLLINPRVFKDTITFEIKNLTDDTVTLQIANRWGEIIQNFFEDTILSGYQKVVYVGDTLPDQTYVVLYIVNSNKSGYSIMKIPPTTIEEEQSSNLSVNIFPNPTSNVVNINSEKRFDSVEIFDLSGKQILACTANNTFNKTINLENIASGEYLLVLKSGLNSVSKRIVIQ